ncbi:AAA family ATPase [Hymenobacter sp. NST-14]|uniref:AAA family ATPase n=1 Tax=Hymenobacter piscis TaxID=2839984 RepID=UPI001C028CE6|nr:AAA family ATPase [Hymenobacter piscis]MBT9395127.1 AAA family ATPase [Hymenobacter piscis]
MENAINTLRIQNFKSIKDVTMKPRRVNLIIGQPNVGKSNILEAMSLLSGIFPRPGSQQQEDTGRYYGGILRYHEVRQLFYDNNTRKPVAVETNSDICVLAHNYATGNGFRYVLAERDTWEKMRDSVVFKKWGAMPNDAEETRLINYLPEWVKENTKPYPQYILSEFHGNGHVSRNDGVSSHGTAPYAGTRIVRPYLFSPPKRIVGEDSTPYLRPPTGENLIQIIESNPILRQKIARMFEPYGLRLLIRIDERRLEVIKDLDGVIYSYPYSSIADTLQRIIFYLAAIESNDDAVILLEEPEAHSYPVYVSMLGRRMVESRNNQFFVATHSPYLITEVLEQMLPDEQQAQELAIFVAYYEDYQTKVKQLSDEEVRAIRNDGLDVFYNMDRYVPRPVNG